jgi:hypothetical protein
MKDVKKTYKDLYMVVAYTAANIMNESTKGQKKLGLIRKKFQPFLDEYNEKRDELRLDHASCDDKGNLILDEKGEYKFTKEGLKKLSQEVKDLSDKEFEYTPIEVINPEGLEIYTFLDGWVNGVKFEKEEEIEL